MVERFVLIKLQDDYATDEGRREVVEETRRVFPNIDGVESVSVGVPADDASAASWDVCIRVCFASLDAYKTYAPHPVHRKYVDVFLRPKLACLKAWNFDLS